MKKLLLTTALTLCLALPAMAAKTPRLVQSNREGRKRMQSYFKKRGVKVVFV